MKFFSKIGPKIWARSSVVWLVVGLWFAVIAVEAIDIITNDICRNINSGNYTLNIRGAFIFSNRLIFISHDWLVYELPSSSIDQNFGQLFMNVTSDPIEKHWSAIGESARFAEIKSKIINIFSLQYKGKQYLYFDIDSNDDAGAGLVYDIENNNLITGEYYYLNSDYQDQAITSENSMHSVITKSDDDEDDDNLPAKFNDWGITMYDDSPLFDGGIVAQYWLFYVVPKDDHTNRTRIAMSYTPHPQSPTDDYDIIPITDWGYPPPAGYLHRDYYHLFVQSQVLIFANKIIAGDEQQSMFHLYQKLTIIEAKNFFVCSHSEHLHNVTYAPIITATDAIHLTLNHTIAPKEKHFHFLGTEKLGSWSDQRNWIIAGVFIAAILLCFIACAVTVFVQQRHRHSGGSVRSGRGTNRGSRRDRRRHHRTQRDHASKRTTKTGAESNQTSMRNVAPALTGRSQNLVLPNNASVSSANKLSPLPASSRPPLPRI